MEEIILKYVLKNAWDFKGSVNNKVVLGAVLREDSSLKKDVPAVLAAIDKEVTKVREMTLDQIKEQLHRVAPELLEEKKVEKIKGPLKELPNAQKGNFVVRIAPSPSGPLHIGHAYGASLNYEYAKMYDGKFILRIEDTNPENLYPPGYKLIEEDAKWLCDDNVAQVVIQSDRLDLYYEAAKKLVDENKVYVCTCDADVWRELKNKGEACPCRDIDSSENKSRYEKMFLGYAPGEAILRLKTDIKHKNPAMRDFPLMRINDHIHPRHETIGKDKRVWPLMVFAVAVDDHHLGVTHVMNGKEHTDNGKKEAIISELLGYKIPVYKHWGRINFLGFRVSASKTRLAIEQNEYTGWDDIRLPFLPALRKRGYQPYAFRRFALETGLSLNDKTVEISEFWKIINSFNKEIVEPMANRYFTVISPKEITIKGAPCEKVLIDLHPDFADRGKRELESSEALYISQKDFDQLEAGKVHRLMDFCNFKREGDSFVYVSKEYDEFKQEEGKGKIIHWVPAKGKLPKVKVMQEDHSIIEGIGEEALSCVKIGSIVQLERQFFARVDCIENNIVTLYYLHQ